MEKTATFLNSKEDPVGLNAAAAKSLQSCLTLCDPIDGSPPGSSVHVAAGNPRVPRLLPGTLGNFPGCL